MSSYIVFEFYHSICTLWSSMWKKRTVRMPKPSLHKVCTNLHFVLLSIIPLFSLSLLKIQNDLMREGAEWRQLSSSLMISTPQRTKSTSPLEHSTLWKQKERWNCQVFYLWISGEILKATIRYYLLNSYYVSYLENSMGYVMFLLQVDFFYNSQPFKNAGFNWKVNFDQPNSKK